MRLSDKQRLRSNQRIIGTGIAFVASIFLHFYGLIYWGVPLGRWWDDITHQVGALVIVYAAIWCEIWAVEFFQRKGTCNGKS